MLGQDVVDTGQVVGPALDDVHALALEQVGQPGAGRDGQDRGRAVLAPRRPPPARASSAKRTTVMWCGRPASSPASMAAPTSSTWTWTFHVSGPVRTTAIESPSSDSTLRSAATARLGGVELVLHLEAVAGLAVLVPGAGPLGLQRHPHRRESTGGAGDHARPARRARSAGPRPAGVDDAGLGEVGELGRGLLQRGVGRPDRGRDGVAEAAGGRPVGAAGRDGGLGRRPGDGEDRALDRADDRGAGQVRRRRRARPPRPRRRSPRRRAAESTAASASPRRTWETMKPELPSAPCAAPVASARQRRRGVQRRRRRRSAASALRRVVSMLLPVSESGTGKTLSASISARCSASRSTAVRLQRRTASASSASSTVTPSRSAAGYWPGRGRRPHGARPGPAGRAVWPPASRSG